MKISEQARNATVKELESNYDRATGKTKFQTGEHVQLLLNSEREKIIKECAEIAWTKGSILTQSQSAYQIHDKILAKLKE